MSNSAAAARRAAGLHASYGGARERWDLVSGAPRSLRADNLGKTLGGALVRLEIDVPEHLATREAPQPDVGWAVEILDRLD